MLQIDKYNFVAHNMHTALLDAISLWIERGDVSTDGGRLLSRATTRSVAGMMFFWNGKEISITGLVAKKNGFTGTKVCLRGSDFTGVAADFVEEILRDYAPYLLPVSNAKPKVSSDNVGDSEDVLAACGL